MKTKKNLIIEEFILGTKDVPGLIDIAGSKIDSSAHAELRLMCHIIKSALEDECIDFIRSGQLYDISKLIDIDYSVLKSCYNSVLIKIRETRRNRDVNFE